MKSKSKNQGFTLIEVIIYVAIAGIIASTLIQYSVTISQSRNKQFVMREVEHNTRAVIGFLEQYIRESDSIATSTSVFGSDPATLVLNRAAVAEQPTTITLTEDNGVVTILQGSGTTTAIMSDTVSVPDFRMEYVTAGDREGVRIFMTVAGARASDVYFEYTLTTTSTILLRQ
ncbi:MAG: PilW family protein [Patescibacteria group bacterium]